MYYDDYFDEDCESRFGGGDGSDGGDGVGGTGQSGLKALKGQYVRIRMRRTGWMIAQVIDYKHGTQLLELNVFTIGSPQPQYMMINARSISALVPLGYNPPAEIGTGYPSQGGYLGQGGYSGRYF